MGVGDWNVGTLERWDVGTLHAGRLVFDVGCLTLWHVVARCGTLLHVVARCWTLDVGSDVERSDIGRWTGRWDVEDLTSVKR